MRIAVLALLLLMPCAWANIGTVTDAPGSAGEIVRGKAKMEGGKGVGIESNDIYATKNAHVGITFKDDTKVKINENSRLVIDDFVYDPSKSDAGKLALKVGMGTVRYASGQIAKNNPQQVAIKTPSATIAVRGTDFSMSVTESGESLVVLLPSCKDESQQKKYELEENKCMVGKIEVITDVGKVTLDQAFQATYVRTSTVNPTPPVVINITEHGIGNGLLLSQPNEVKRAIKQHAKTLKDQEQEELESDAQLKINQRIKDTNDEVERARVLMLTEYLREKGCNITTNVCVNWDRPEMPDVQSRGKAIAVRNLENEHYAEVKTQGSVSQTFVTIVHNDNAASELIGDPSYNVSNTVYIKQNSGVLRRR